MFKPIHLKNGKIVQSMSDARLLIERIGTRERSEAVWVNAIAEYNNAVFDSRREEAASKLLHSALVASGRA